MDRDKQDLAISKLYQLLYSFDQDDRFISVKRNIDNFVDFERSKYPSFVPKTEFGRIVLSFNQLIEMLEHREVKLNEYSSHLELCRDPVKKIIRSFLKGKKTVLTEEMCKPSQINFSKWALRKKMLLPPKTLNLDDSKYDYYAKSYINNDNYCTFFNYVRRIEGSKKVFSQLSEECENYINIRL